MSSSDSIRDGIAARVLELAAYDTTSGSEDRMLPALSALLESCGARTLTHEVEPGRTNVLALFGAPRVVFTTHLDCVPPFIAPRREGDLLHGRGTADAKGQIVAFLEAIRRLRAEGESDLAFLGVVGEESDAIGAAAVDVWRDLLAPCRLLVNGEPTDLKLGTGQRGYQHLRLQVRGLAAHSGLPELGRSAVDGLLDWLARIRELPRRSDVELGPEVRNIGILRGGEAVNVVAAHASAEILCRTVPRSEFLADLRACAPAEATVEVLVDEAADRYPRVEGFDYAALPFGSDLPTLRRLLPEATAVLMGAGSIHLAHTADERIGIDDILAAADIARRLALTVLRDSTT